jgi:hypothetical protein
LAGSDIRRPDDRPKDYQLFTLGRAYGQQDNGAAGVSWRHQFLGGEQAGEYTLKEMTLRVDKAQPFKQNWQVMGDGTSTGIPDAQNLIQKVREADRFVVQTVPYDALPVTAVFEVKGIKDALLSHRPECDWFIRDLLWEQYQQKLKDEAGSKSVK